MLRTFAVVLIVSALALSGCQTLGAGKAKVDSQIQDLQNQVSVMEIRLKENEEELLKTRKSVQQLVSENEDLRAGLSDMKKKASKSSVAEFRKPLSKQVQIALRNAGFNPGPIDGKMGVQTRNAIRAFQKANRLPVSGDVDYNTWQALKEFLYKKQK
ncbi:MAG: peptidoglycan-binding domain-containing protein [Candidatus Omnitrophica bacterium]|nr:peptidoglycan-binding domain-containing protein [Candidatus Omnitrophota bacterium]